MSHVLVNLSLKDEKLRILRTKLQCADALSEKSSRNKDESFLEKRALRKKVCTAVK